MKKVIAASAASAMSMLLLAGCSSPNAQSMGQTREGTEIVWAMQAGNPANIIVDVAVEAGIAENHGISFEKVDIAGNPNQIAAVINGSADVFLATVDALAAARQQGQEVSMFCGHTRTFALPIMVRPELGLKSYEELDGDWTATLQQLEGLKLGVPTRGSAFELRTTALLESAGLSGDDVTYVPVGVGPTVMAALKAGQIDGMLYYPPNHLDLESSGHATTLVDANEHGPEEFRELFGVAYAAADTWLEDNPSAAGSICDMQAQAAAEISTGEHDDQLRAIVRGDYGISEGAVDPVVDYLTDDYYSSDIEKSSIDKVLHLLIESDVLEPSSNMTAAHLIRKPE